MGEISRLEKLEQQRAALQLKIAAEQKKLKDVERRQDTRRKILTGAIALNHANKDAQFNAALRSQLETQIEAKDRYLFPDIWPDATPIRTRRKQPGEQALQDLKDTAPNS